jgi:FkbM family methyltransferase
MHALRFTSRCAVAGPSHERTIRPSRSPQVKESPVTHHPIFSRFSRVKSTGTGHHVFDFIGTKTDAAFRRGWSQHATAAGAEVQPPYPPANEHYFDWVATLTAVDRCSGTFRMAELGAGWAPWLTRAALAAHQRPAIMELELVAVEADAVHYDWVCQHFEENRVGGAGVHALRGAVAAQAGTIRFPKVDNPDENYGASTRAVRAGTEYVEVTAYTLEQVLDRFTGPVDLVHIDIQGAEYDALPPAMPLLRSHTKSIMIGTHISLEHHRQMAGMFQREGWREVFNFERNALCDTQVGPIQFGDGFLLFDNPALLRGVP